MARSSFYYKPVDRSAKIAADAGIVDQLRAIAARWPQYGYRRMAATLKAGGTVVNKKRLLRLMRESGLTVRPTAPLRPNDEQRPSVSHCQKSLCNSHPGSGEPTLGQRHNLPRVKGRRIRVLGGHP